VCPTDRWRDPVSREDCATDRWRWRPLAHRTVQCTTGQSGELLPHRLVAFPESDEFAADDPPDSPVNYNRTPASLPETGYFTGGMPGAPDTVRCTTEQSGVPGRAVVLAAQSQVFLVSFLLLLSLFLALRQTH
jgi:hypothetical protein